MRQAIDLAIEERRASLEPLHVEQVWLDSSAGEAGEWSASKEAANAAAAVQDQAVVAYIGAYNSGATAISLPITRKAGLLQISPTNTWPGLTSPGYDDPSAAEVQQPGRTTFLRLMPGDDDQGRAAAIWAEQMGVRHALVVSDASTYSAGLGRAFQEVAPQRGIEISGTAELEDILRRGSLQANRADAVFYAPGSVNDAVRFASAPPSLQDVEHIFLSDVALTDEFLEAAVPDPRKKWHVIFNGIDMPEASPSTDAFQTAFKKKYGSDPSQFAANAYDAAVLVIDALAVVRSADRGAVLDRVTGATAQTDTTGPLAFNSHGDRTRWSMSGYDVVQGTFKLATVINGP
ncbi:MAG TPA: branched-chain amino acid ABC transporter substrate-binding protein [Chloroflexia bacterium]|nr:branched-chain amino acid ABC transporter substrate-binding protein [Chloroflexia bacterium]